MQQKIETVRARIVEEGRTEEKDEEKKYEPKCTI